MAELRTGKLYIAALLLAAAGFALGTASGSGVLVVAAARISISMAAALVLLALFTWNWQLGAAGMNVYKPQRVEDVIGAKSDDSAAVEDGVEVDGDALAG